MNEATLENFLARLYTDAQMQKRFLADPASEAQRAGLSPQNCAAVARINPIELRLAARSFAHKRRKRVSAPLPRGNLVRRWIAKIRKVARSSG